MSNLMSRETTSSLHIEPVNTDEYNRSLTGQLSSHHKRQFLQCIQSEPNFLRSKCAFEGNFSKFYKAYCNSITTTYLH